MTSATQHGTTASGIAFVSCAAASQPSGHAHDAPAELARVRAAAGRGFRTIDMHAHCAIPQAMDLMGLNIASVGGGRTRSISRLSSNYRAFFARIGGVPASMTISSAGGSCITSPGVSNGRAVSDRETIR